MFIALDGIDGGGKSTQVERLAAWLRERGRTVVACRDPGSTPLGERIRGVLLEHSDLAIGGRAEMLLYMAARAQLVAEVIRPALDRGDVVVTDRYLVANVVYQGHAGRLSPEEIWAVGRVATGGLLPDVAFVLDLPANAAFARLRRGLDRMESRGLDYFERVRAGFLAECGTHPHVVAIDADRPPEAIQTDLRERLVARFPDLEGAAP